MIHRKSKAYSVIELLVASALTLSLGAVVALSLNSSTNALRTSNGIVYSDIQAREITSALTKYLSAGSKRSNCEPDLNNCLTYRKNTGDSIVNYYEFIGGIETLIIHTSKCFVVGRFNADGCEFGGQLKFEMDHNLHKLIISEGSYGSQLNKSQIDSTVFERWPALNMPSPTRVIRTFENIETKKTSTGAVARLFWVLDGNNIDLSSVLTAGNATSVNAIIVSGMVPWKKSSYATNNRILQTKKREGEDFSRIDIIQKYSCGLGSPSC